MPVDGGAIQPAISPGPNAAFINEPTCTLFGIRREPVVASLCPLGVTQDATVRAHVMVTEDADFAVEADMRQRQFGRDAVLGERPVPAAQALRAIEGVLATQFVVDERTGRQGLGRDRTIGHGQVLIFEVEQDVIVVVLVFAEAPLQAGGVVVRCVGRLLAAEEVKRDRVVEVDVLLQRVEVDATVARDVRRCRTHSSAQRCAGRHARRRSHRRTCGAPPLSA